MARYRSVGQYAQSMQTAMEAMCRDLREADKEKWGGKTTSDMMLAYLAGADEEGSGREMYDVWSVAEPLYSAVIGEPTEEEPPADLLESVNSLLSVLRPDERELIVMRYGQNMTLQEIADKQGHTRQWIQIRLDKMIHKLRTPPYVTYLRRGREAAEKLIALHDKEHEAEIHGPTSFIDELELSTRARNSLCRRGIYTLEALRTFLRKGGKLSKLHGVGARTESEILQALINYDEEGKTCRQAS